MGAHGAPGLGVAFTARSSVSARPAGHRAPHGHVGLALSSKRGVGTLRVSLNSCFVTTHK